MPIRQLREVSTEHPDRHLEVIYRVPDVVQKTAQRAPALEDATNTGSWVAIRMMPK
jgi:hypothetical protein